MSEPALSVAFFDPAHGIHGSARAGVSLLFDGSHSHALAESPEIERAGERFRAKVAGGFEVELEPVAEAVRLGGADTRVCRATGMAGGREISGLGTVTETHEPPEWERLDAVRGISAIFDEGHAILAVARRPRGAIGHGAEEVEAVILDEGEVKHVESARLSTVYDGDGRQRTCGLELWLPGQDFPRRAFGTVVSGTTLQLERLVVNASVFAWRMESREGAGAYDLVVRPEPPDAA